MLIKKLIPLVVNIVVLGSTVFYVDEIRQFPIWAQFLFIIGVSLITMVSDNATELAIEKNRNSTLRRKNQELKKRTTKKARDLAELQEVIVTFIDNSELYRDRVKELLGVKDDYLCIIKSSEGLSEVWQQLEKKRPLPFTQILMELPGAVMPFERINFVLVPVRNLPGLNPNQVREYIEAEIIPLVRRRRTQFLRDLPPDISALAGDFSYKYIAFVISKENVHYNIRNRKFNEAFTAFLVNEQLVDDFRQLKKELAEVVKTKDILNLINWSSFANLNSEQSAIIEEAKAAISRALRVKGIEGLSDLANLAPIDLRHIIRPHVPNDISDIRVLNICKKAVNGATHVVSVLRSNGVKI